MPAPGGGGAGEAEGSNFVGFSGSRTRAVEY